MEMNGYEWRREGLGGSGAVHVHVRGPKRTAVKREAEWE
jgi:hypothetical protein